MAKTEQKRELKTEIIAFRVTASFKAKLQALAAADKRELKDFIRLKLEECLPASMQIEQ
jgi:raw score 10.36